MNGRDNNSRINNLPKAELHCHLEGAASPELVRRLARRHGMHLPESLFDNDGFAWTDFSDFLAIYDIASSVIKTAQDYTDLTYEYLQDCAAEGAIYVEVFSSPDHAAKAGMDYDTHLEGIVAGCEKAEKEYGIVARIIPTCVRHLGAERALAVADQVVASPHPFVVGFGMGGDERYLQPGDFAPAFDKIDQAGLPTTVHAGEILGAESVWKAITDLPVCRIGHGVRAVEDPVLMETLATRNIHLEICPGSNIALSIFSGYESHPVMALRAAGISVGLNSDDPPYFATSIGLEYAMMQKIFGLDDRQLLAFTRDSIKAAFVDAPTREKLEAKINIDE